MPESGWKEKLNQQLSSFKDSLAGPKSFLDSFTEQTLLLDTLIASSENLNRKAQILHFEAPPVESDLDRHARLARVNALNKEAKDLLIDLMKQVDEAVEEAKTAVTKCKPGTKNHADCVRKLNHAMSFKKDYLALHYRNIPSSPDNIGPEKVYYWEMSTNDRRKFWTRRLNNDILVAWLNRFKDVIDLRAVCTDKKLYQLYGARFAVLADELYFNVHGWRHMNESIKRVSDVMMRCNWHFPETDLQYITPWST